MKRYETMIVHRETLAWLPVILCLLWPTAARSQPVSTASATASDGGGDRGNDRSASSASASSPQPRDVAPSDATAAPRAQEGGSSTGASTGATEASSSAAPVRPEARGQGAPAGPLPFPIRAYGILRTTIDVSNGVESYTNPNATAVTAAANPVFLTNSALLLTPDSAFLSFQVQQSRIGVMVNEGGVVRGQLELDFIHFNMASPTLNAFPRVRIAEVQLAPVAGHKFFLGQSWDVFSPLNSHTLNLVGGLFQAGNAGFMRHQLGWSGTFSNVELTLAAGFQGANDGPSFSSIEVDAVPTGSARLWYRNARKDGVGVSAIATAVRYVSAPVAERRLTLGVNAFAEVTLGPVNLRAELYFGQNLANIGALTLSQGRFGVDVRELGGWISSRFTLGLHSLALMAGAANVLSNNVVPGYTESVAANAMTMTNAVSAVRTVTLGPGVASNLVLRAHYAANVWRGLSIMVEPYLYRTVHVLHPSDEARFSETRWAAGVEAGALFTF